MLLSFVFTYLIVIRPVEFFGVKKQSTNLTTSQDSGAQIRANYTLEDVFRPTRLVLTNNNKPLMAQVKNNIIMQGVSGKVGKQIVY